MGPFPCPRSFADLIPASMYLQPNLTARGTSNPLARFEEMAAVIKLACSNFADVG
jgi:hypothetical protein